MNTAGKTATVTSFRVGPDLLREIDQLAAKTGYTRSILVRMAVEDLVDHVTVGKPLNYQIIKRVIRNKEKRGASASTQP